MRAKEEPEPKKRKARSFWPDLLSRSYRYAWAYFREDDREAQESVVEEFERLSRRG